MALILVSEPRCAVAQIQAEQSAQRGQVDLRDIDLDEPALKSLLRLLRPADDAGTRSTVTLYRLRLDFERSSDTLVIRNGVACSEDFALTIEGYAGLPAGELHFNGVLWPAMDATGLGRAIPIVGALGKRSAPAVPAAAHRGVFPLNDPSLVPIGVSYALTGTSAAPLLRINPFADPYPGPLRRVATVCGQPDAGGG